MFSHMLNRSFSRWSTLRTDVAGGGGGESSSTSGGAVKNVTESARSNGSGPSFSAQHDQDPANVKMRPSAMDRRFWFGLASTKITVKYLKKCIQKARSWARIRINLYMLAATAVASVIMVYSGKRAAERGENLHDMNLDWHRKINEEHRKQEAAVAKE